MPYITVVAGTTITAAWGNTNVRDQVVTPFANTAARTSAITSPVDGMIVYLADVDWYERYKTSTGWQRLDWNDSWGEVGGKRWAISGAALALGIAATEALTNMDSGSVTLIPGRSYRFTVRMPYIAAGGTKNYWLAKIRRNGLTGTQWGDTVFPTDQNSFGQTAEFSFSVGDVGAAITDTFVLTCVRLSGADAININRGNSQSPGHIIIEDDGPANRVTAV